MPLVQSLDILRQRVTNPLLQGGARRRARAGAGGQRRCRRRSRRTGRCFPGVYTASLLAGEKSGNLEQVIRRYVAYVKVVSGVKRKTISALVYPAILLVLSLIVVGIIVLKVVPEFGAFYNQFGQELPLSTRIIVGVLDVRRDVFLFSCCSAVVAAAGGLLGVAEAARATGAGSIAGCCGCRCSGRSRRSSRRRRRRARWRRCSAAASRW